MEQPAALLLGVFDEVSRALSQDLHDMEFFSCFLYFIQIYFGEPTKPAK